MISNIINLRDMATTKFVAALAVLSLLISAFPVAFFVANAAAPTVSIDGVVVTHNELTFTLSAEATAPDSLEVVATNIYDSTDTNRVIEIGRLNDPVEGFPVDTELTFSEILTRDISALVPGNTYIIRGYAKNHSDEEGRVTQSFVVPHAPVVPCTVVENTTTGDCYATVQEAVDAATAGDAIILLTDVTTTQQITINKPLTLNGNGRTISADFTKTDNSNNSAIGVQSAGVTIENITLDGVGDAAWPHQLHGINANNANDFTLQSVVIRNFEGSGLNVGENSTANVYNLTTSGNGWNGINVDKVNAVLNIYSTSSHNEARPIYVDDITVGAVNDINNQYTSEDIDNINDVDGGVTDPRTARVYTLTPPPTTGGGGGGYTPGNRPGSSTPDGEVLGESVDLEELEDALREALENISGEQTTVVPTGAPNTGAGGMNYYVVALALALAAFATRRFTTN